MPGKQGDNALSECHSVMTLFLGPSTGGSVVERYLFDPYGTRTIMNASWSILSSTAYAWVTGYQGLTHDVESGLVYNRRRMLNTAPDPVGEVCVLSAVVVEELTYFAWCCHCINSTAASCYVDFSKPLPSPRKKGKCKCTCFQSGKAPTLPVDADNDRGCKSYCWVTYQTSAYSCK